MKLMLSLKQKSALMLLLLCFSVVGGQDLTAEAKKKAATMDPAVQAAAEAEAKAKAAEAELKKGLDSVTKDLNALMINVQARKLFSPAEAGKLVDIKYKLLDMMEQFPQNAMLAKPVYQAGTLFTEREAYNDAFELFNYLAQGYTTNPYGAKAKGQIQQLERRFGANYFSVEMAAPAPVVAGTPPATAVPATASTPPAAAPAKK